MSGHGGRHALLRVGVLVREREAERVRVGVTEGVRVRVRVTDPGVELREREGVLVGETEREGVLVGEIGVRVGVLVEETGERDGVRVEETRERVGVDEGEGVLEGDTGGEDEGERVGVGGAPAATGANV